MAFMQTTIVMLVLRFGSGEYGAVGGVIMGVV